jgi:hypothetical protein
LSVAHRGSRKDGMWLPAQLRDRSSAFPSRVSRRGVCRAIAVAIALCEPPGVLLAVADAGPRADLQLHQALGREADHLAEQVRITASSPRARKGLSWSWSSGASFSPAWLGNPTLPISSDRPC